MVGHVVSLFLWGKHAFAFLFLSIKKKMAARSSETMQALSPSGNPGGKQNKIKQKAKTNKQQQKARARVSVVPHPHLRKVDLPVWILLALQRRGS